MSIYIILYFLLIHWFADFVMQADDDAKNKSKNIRNLLNHTAIYAQIMTAASFVFLITSSLMNVLIFGLVMFISHTTIDFFTSRINSKLYAANKNHLFFTSIGFDQWLHYLVLFGSLDLIF